MSIRVTIECDASYCQQEFGFWFDREFDEAINAEEYGFVEDPENTEYHYCKKCWPIVQAERERTE